MKIPPPYIITPPILNLLSNIDSLRLYAQKKDLPKYVSGQFRRNSLLKSSLYSARIEGNSLSELTLHEDSIDTETQEIVNILQTLEYIEATDISQIDRAFIQKLHAMVGIDIFSEKGSYRKEVSGIFNKEGIVVYMPPPPTQVFPLMDRLISYMQSEDNFPLITAFITHLVFEKIHPFLDGNGRVGRALIPAVLKSKKYIVPFPVIIEEYLDTHRDQYYDVLLSGMKDTEDYLIFMLSAYWEQIKITVEKLEQQSKKPSIVQELTARQEEIYNIVREHKTITLNFIVRRFMKVSERTLRNDLIRLVEKKLIIKIGSTKGVEYRRKE